MQNTEHVDSNPPPTPTMEMMVRLDVISIIAGKWRVLADLLEIDLSVIDTIGAKKDDPMVACYEVFSWWLSGKGIKCTWENLIKVLDILNFHDLSLKIRHH